MNQFDWTLLRWLTSFANVWPSFDGFLAFLVNWEVAKGGLVVALYWWAWFRPEKNRLQQRVRLIVALAAAMLALALAGAAALILPYRPRPRVLAGLEPPTGGWAEWSAFPSDHATLFFALATGLWAVAPWLGMVAFLHAVFVVCWPRAYLGLHYPTDLLAGGVIGVVVGVAAQRSRRLQQVGIHVVKWETTRPASFYAVAFVAMYLLATLFSDLRRAGNSFVMWWLGRGAA